MAIVGNLGSASSDNAGTKQWNVATTTTYETEELEHAEEQRATFLASQLTLGFGKMRRYQLEGLN